MRCAQPSRATRPILNAAVDPAHADSRSGGLRGGHEERGEVLSSHLDEGARPAATFCRGCYRAAPTGNSPTSTFRVPPTLASAPMSAAIPPLGEKLRQRNTRSLHGLLGPPEISSNTVPATQSLAPDRFKTSGLLHDAAKIECVARNAEFWYNRSGARVRRKPTSLSTFAHRPSAVSGQRWTSLGTVAAERSS